MADIITAKAELIQKDTGFTPDALPVGTIFSILQQFLQLLFKCNPTPAQVHQALTNPTRRQRRIQGRVVASNIDDPGMVAAVEESIAVVGSRLTSAETSAIWQQVSTGGGIVQQAEDS